jgi:hypothetical protein
MLLKVLRRLAPGGEGVPHGGQFLLHGETLSLFLQRRHATDDFGITKNATRLDELANPDHKLMDGRVAARKTEKLSSKSERIV